MTVPLKQGRSAHEVGEAWTAADASELYEIDRWGKGYFKIGEDGHVHVHPTKEVQRSIDLKQLIDQLQGEHALRVPESCLRPAAG